MRLDEAARTYLGIPWLHQGRNPRVGVDCIGLLALAVSHVGRSDLLTHDLLGYARDPHDGLLEQGLIAAFGAPVATMQAGDIVAIAFPRVVRHVGVLGEYPEGGLSLIHTWNRTAGRVVEMRLDDKWADRIRSVYRLGAT